VPGEPLWQHFLDEGPRDAPVIVMLHGNPTWSFAFRKLVVGLRARYRCIVPDHIGCGLSDRPQDWSYRLADHIANVEKLIDRLRIERFSLAVHDWGGAIGMGVATERPHALVSSTVMNTAAFRSPDIPLSIASVRIPVFGRFAVLRCNAFAGVAAWRAMGHHERMTPIVKAGFLDPYGNAHDRIATLRFVEDIPLEPSHPSYARLQRIEERLPLLADKPMLLAWGKKDFCFTTKFLARWQAMFPQAPHYVFDDAGHYVLEDAHERILPLMQLHLAQAVR
jgi:haloalkane dehalogenase